MSETKELRNKYSAVDLFCGIGGLSYGLIKAGINVKVGVDIDETCRFAFEENCNSKFECKSVEDLNKETLLKYFGKSKYKILVGCAPCQPFSNYTLNADKSKDNRWLLLESFAKAIFETKPDIVSMENVPQLAKFKHSPVFPNFVKTLEEEGYKVSYQIVYAPDYGIPQKRKRLVLLASRHGSIQLIPPTHSSKSYVSVKDVIGGLEEIGSGEVSEVDFIHRASQLSEKNLLRIKQSRPGGSWKRDWDEELLLDCHKSEKGKTYGSMYGRMTWDEPSPTMTTHCIGIGNGRFGHPEQDRAISLREASLLQSFPIEYKFAKDKDSLSVRSVSKHIGNAVPPRLGEIIGLSIIEHLEKLER
jgi:DNA (cytosine-5)-methyltransferase 1